MSDKKYKLGIFALHPIQYQAPIFKELAKAEDIDSTVLYCEKHGLKPKYNPEFKSIVVWDIPLLDGYKYKFFRNFAFNNLTGFWMRFNPGLVWHLLTTKYDAVLVHGFNTFTSWLVLFAAKITGKKVIFRGEATARKSRKSLLKRFARNGVKIYYSLCNAFLFSCTGNRDYYTQYGIKDHKLFPIPCAVNNEFFREERGRLLADRDSLRKEIGISGNNFVISFAARFTDRKKPLDLIKAVAESGQDNITILFIGGGPEEDEMRALAKQYKINCVFTGFVGQKEISKYYIASDMFAIISSYDASPKSLNEALNFELPILSSDMVGTAFDLVQEGVNGFITEVGDIQTMAEKISFLCNNREKATKMGRKSLEIVENWSFAADVDGIRQALRYICGERK